MRSAFRSTLAAVAVLTGATAILVAQPGSSQLSLDNLWKVRTFSEPRWAPDSRSIAFTMEDPEANADIIYVATIDGALKAVERAAPEGDTAKAKRPSRRSLLERPWTPDGRQLLYTASGGIRALDIASGATRTLTSFSGPSIGYVAQEYFNGPDATLSPDGSRLAFVRESEIRVLDVAAGGIRQITTSHPQGWHNLQPRWSPDGRQLLYTAQAIDEQRRFPATDYSGLVIAASFRLIGSGRVRLGVVSADGGETTWLGPSEGLKYSLRGGSQAQWSPDGKAIVINRISLDHTGREILVASPDSGKVRPVWHEKVDRWISPMAIWVRWSPDSKSLLLTSEQSGWNHVNVLPATGGEPRAVTSGSFTVTSNQVYEASESTPDWSRDGQSIYFPSNEAATAERHLYAVAATGGSRRQISTTPGVDWASSISPNGQRAAYFHSDLTTLPELYVQEMSGGPAKRLTTLAMPPDLKDHRWLNAEIVSFKNRKDGTAVAARLYVPPGLNRNQSHPAVVYVHGAGYTQSVYRGWTSGPNRTAFNQYLAEQGYVVLDVDFRGSSGYGRQFRLDVYDRMGDSDLEDVLSGVEYLETLGYVDSRRVGIWGHSYGGFMVSIAMFRAPETFAAGAAGAPVTDWERFYYLAPGYNEEHLGFPWGNKEGTRRASPLTYAKDLKRPFLLLSGVQDTMHLDSAALVNTLLEHRKTFDWFFYPNEPHGFREPQAREDYYRRIADFFKKHLAAAGSTTSEAARPH